MADAIDQAYKHVFDRTEWMAKYQPICMQQLADSGQRYASQLRMALARQPQAFSTMEVLAHGKAKLSVAYSAFGHVGYAFKAVEFMTRFEGAKQPVRINGDAQLGVKVANLSKAV